MSIQALSWVFKQKIRPSSLKFVLVAIADCANEQMTCWPSIAHICHVTSLERKTALNSIQTLVKAGYLVDTGKKVGKTNQIKVYRLNIVGISNSTDIGTLKQSQNSVKQSQFSMKESQKRDTEPLLTIKEPKNGKNSFKKILLQYHFTPSELLFVLNEDDELSGDTHIIRTPSRFAADRLDQLCSYKLNDIFPKWKIVIEKKKAA